MTIFKILCAAARTFLGCTYRFAEIVGKSIAFALYSSAHSASAALSVDVFDFSPSRSRCRPGTGENAPHENSQIAFAIRFDGEGAHEIRKK